MSADLHRIVAQLEDVVSQLRQLIGATPAADAASTVYVADRFRTRVGPKVRSYHRLGCSFFPGRPIEMELAAARGRGLGPCSHCH